MKTTGNYALSFGALWVQWVLPRPETHVQGWIEVPSTFSNEWLTASTTSFTGVSDTALTLNDLRLAMDNMFLTTDNTTS